MRGEAGDGGGEVVLGRGVTGTAGNAASASHRHTHKFRKNLEGQYHRFYDTG